MDAQLRKLAGELNDRSGAAGDATRLPALMREVIAALAELGREIDSYPGYPGSRAEDAAKVIALRDALEARLERLAGPGGEGGGKK